MPLRVIGGVSHDESQLLGIEMGIFGETIMNTACYGQELQPSTVTSKLFGLSTGSSGTRQGCLTCFLKQASEGIMLLQGIRAGDWCYQLAW